MEAEQLARSHTYGGPECCVDEGSAVKGEMRVSGLAKWEAGRLTCPRFSSLHHPSPIITHHPASSTRHTSRSEKQLVPRNCLNGAPLTWRVSYGYNACTT